VNPERRIILPTDRMVLSLADFTELDIAALAATRAPESSKEFDDEVESSE